MNDQKKNKDNTKPNSKFCRLCYIEREDSRLYCDEHSPANNDHERMTNYRKTIRIFHRAIKTIIKTYPKTKKTLVSTNSSFNLDEIWGVLKTDTGRKEPNLEYYPILQDDDALKDPTRILEWGMTFSKFLVDLPHAGKKLSKIVQLENENQISNTVNNLMAYFKQSKPKNLIPILIRCDQYLLICKLGKSTIGRPKKNKLRETLKVLKEQGLSYSKIGEKLNISKARAGKIGKELGLK